MESRYLFRGKRSDNLKKDWVMGHYVSVPRHMIVFDELQLNGSWNCFDVDPATVGQCTGLYAAKSYRGESEADRLIFEGDIILVSRHGGKEIWEHEIKDIRRLPENMFGSNVGYIEIIGTIHDRTEGEG